MPVSTWTHAMEGARLAKLLWASFMNAPARAWPEGGIGVVARRGRAKRRLKVAVASHRGGCAAAMRFTGVVQYSHMTSTALTFHSKRIPAMRRSLRIGRSVAVNELATASTATLRSGARVVLESAVVGASRWDGHASRAESAGNMGLSYVPRWSAKEDASLDAEGSGGVRGRLRSCRAPDGSFVGWAEVVAG